MAWTELFQGQTDFAWALTPITEVNLLRVTHLDLVVRGNLLGYSAGRTEIAQFDETANSFFEPKIIRSEVESQIILFPKLKQFSIRRIGIRNSLGFDPQLIKLEGDIVPVFYEQSQSSVATSVNRKPVDRKNVAQEVVPENPLRKGLTLRNTSKVVVNINYVDDATATSFITQIPANASWEMQPNFLGRVSAWWVGSDATKPTAAFAGEFLNVMEFL
jgi:hypothetical protein